MLTASRRQRGLHPSGRSLRSTLFSGLTYPTLLLFAGGTVIAVLPGYALNVMIDLVDPSRWPPVSRSVLAFSEFMSNWGLVFASRSHHTAGHLDLVGSTLERPDPAEAGVVSAVRSVSKVYRSGNSFSLAGSHAIRNSKSPGARTAGNRTAGVSGISCAHDAIQVVSRRSCRNRPRHRTVLSGNAG